MQVPTGKDLGKTVMVRDRDDSAWKGPFELQGVRVPVTHYPYIADDNGWAYAKLVDEEQGEDRTAFRAVEKEPMTDTSNNRNTEALSEAQEFARDRMRQGRFRPAGYSTWATAMDAARLALPDGDIEFVYKVGFAIWRISPSFVGDQTLYMDLGDDWPGHNLRRAEAEMQDRAASRDERSMGRAVAGFCAIYGETIRARVEAGLPPLDETMGWQFMSILKKARGAAGAYREDDYTDDVAYAALAAESAAGGEA